MAKHKGILTKGAKLEFAHFSTPGDASTAPGTYEEVANVLRMPSLGGEQERVEVTTLADSAHMYINGLIEYGELEFQLLYDNEEATSNYRVLKALGDEVVSVRVTLGDVPIGGTHGTQFVFAAQLNASIDEQEPGQALTFTTRAMLQSDIEATMPA